jgi:hypothetical protein
MFWSPLFVLASIGFDVYMHWPDTEYRSLAITAAIGWLMYWDTLNDLRKYEDEDETNG